MVVDITDIEQTKKLAEQLAKKLKKGDVIALVGELGTGKTTFTQFLLHELGVNDHVPSPTFVFERQYELPSLKTSACHIDLYRAESADIVRDLTLDFENQITIIEWPHSIKDLLPKRTQWIHFRLKGNTRTAKIGDIRN